MISVEPNMMVKKTESVLADGVRTTQTGIVGILNIAESSRNKNKNSIISSRNNSLRNMEVRLQIENLLKWKKKKVSTVRWISKEASFSTIKRTFGEPISASKFHNMVKEMMIKLSLYNLFRRI